MCMKKFSLSLLVTAAISVGMSQESEGYVNPNSVRGVHSSDIMYKKSILRQLDLREKQNKSLFSRNKEITRIIIDAVKEGKLKIYATDSLDKGRSLTKEEFLENIKIPNQEAEMTEEEKQFQQANAANAANDPFASTDQVAATGPAFFEPKDLFLLQITEDFLFDKQRSRAYWDIQAIQIIVPSELNQKVDLPAGTFKYKDLVEVFKKDPRALWFNPENDQEHRNMADAFDLRLFSSYLVKVSNPDDAYLADIYNTNEKEGLLASYWKANEMMEYEHNLWEF